MLRVLVLLLLLAPAAAGAKWFRAESPGFVAYSRSSEADLRLKLRQLQDFDALLRLLTGLDPPASASRLPVYFVQGHDFPLLGMRNPNIDGFFMSSPGSIAAFIATDRARSGFTSSTTVLFHEYTHRFMFHAARAAYPAWYIEGFAEYLSTAKFTDDYVEYGNYDQGRAYGLVAEKWLPMQRVITGRSTDFKSVEDAAQFYAQSWLLVHYLSRDPERRKQLHAYLAAIGHGVPPDTAFPAAFGMDYDAMGGRLRAYLKGSGFTRSRLRGVAPTAAGAATTVTTLPPSSEGLLLPAARLAMLPFGNFDKDEDDEAPATERQALLTTVRDEARKFPGDDYAATVLAEAEVKLGDRKFGTAALDALLARSPADAQALYLRGMVLLADAGSQTGEAAAATAKRARVLLTRANAARPDDYRILAGHAETFGDARLSDGELAVLLRANELAPEVAPIASYAAEALAARGDKQQAVALLTPIANDPHGGAAAGYATALIRRFEGKPDPAAGPAAKPAN